MRLAIHKARAASVLAALLASGGLAACGSSSDSNSIPNSISKRGHDPIVAATKNGRVALTVGGLQLDRVSR